MREGGVSGGALIDRVVHRSSAGPEREITVFGRPACARCTALFIGFCAGQLLGLIAGLPWSVVLLALPALLDAAWEKRLGGHLHRGRLVLVNLLAGLGGGAAFGLLVARGHVLVAVGLISVARFVVPPVVRRLAAAASSVRAEVPS